MEGQMTIYEACGTFSSPIFRLEIGPWGDDGAGTVIREISFGTANGEILEAAQFAANEQNRKVIISVSGDHNQYGTTRTNLEAFYPQIRTSLRTPESISLELKAPQSGKIVAKGDTKDEAEKLLMEKVYNAITMLYHWPGVQQPTKRVIPEPPEGYQLIVLLIQTRNNSDDWGDCRDYFFAIPQGKRVCSTGSVNQYGEFLIAPRVKQVELPEGSYYYDNECWTMMPQHSLSQ